jgi:hypothetical protein
VRTHLSDQDLKDIGVPLGHRRKMLAAIGELAGAALAPLEPATATEPKSGPRRQDSKDGLHSDLRTHMEFI